MFKLPFETQYTFQELCDLSTSQAKQDLFVLAMLEGKTRGTFLEIGCNRPQSYSNCYLLETSFDWSGISIDIKDYTDFDWDIQRPKSKYIIADAVAFDYSTVPDYFDYLQLDIDDSYSTMSIIDSLQNKEFGVITIEHDAFRKTKENFALKNFARQAFTKKGYVILADNVCVDIGDKKINCFEDWYVNPNIIRKEVVEAYQSLTWDYRLKYGEDVLFAQNTL